MNPRIKKWKQALVRHRIFAIVLLLIQFALLAFMISSTTRVSSIIRDILSLIGFLAALYVIGKEGEPTAKLTWVFLIMLVPVFGGLFYLFYTYQYGKKNLRKLLGRAEESLMPLFFSELSVLQALESEEHDDLSLMRYLEGCCHFPVYAHTEVNFYSPGEDFYPVLIEELKKAERYIFIESFIIEEGTMWNGILDILREKVSQGLNVRVLYDDVGCFFTLPKDYCKQLQSYGIQAKTFNPFRATPAVTQNQRDHRKIISIDGKTVFTGGSNLADEYINLYPKHGHWHDSMIRVRGEAAWCLTLISLQLHDINAGSEEIAKLCPWQDEPCEIESDGYVQPYGDNPLRGERVGENVYLHVIQHAKDYVYIDTPYLVIDDTMVRALSLSAKCGVDVRIVTPRIPDHPMVQMCSRSFYAQLIRAGVKIYEYTPGFMHSKICVSDDRIAVVGSSNFDYRSMYQQFEDGAVLYGCSAIDDIKSNYLHTLELCERKRENEFAATMPQRLWHEILRLFSPLM